uniref:ATP synthase subunit a n=1 Tax=Oopsacas minuta TaxID=111878 RepID=A0A0G3ZAT6_9METZ|nr:ATP synthase F0 subunit 6 [Oopsacas minuta]AKM54874.1 ATP synthase F0 subunit 6 [Oopsacas minuta]
MNAAYFDQFNMKKLLYMKTSETMLSMSNLTLTLLIIALLMITINKNYKMLPNRNTMMTHTLLKMTLNLTNEHMKNKQLTYNPLMFTMFTTLMTMNLMGLLPYVFTTTSHMIITFSLSLTIMMKTTMSALMKHNSKFLSMLTPQSAPLPLAPFLVLMETTSYITRAISLGVRLAANMSAGHLLLTILSSFALNTMTSNYYLLSILPMTALCLMSLLEMMVALMQAYVFTLLTTIYMSDTTKLH